MTKNIINKLIVSTVVAGVILISGKTTVFADCETNYGGGETCKYDRKFEVVKEVRICDKDEKNCTEWEQKLKGAKLGDIIEFRIRVYNRSDKGAGESDDMKMKDILPEELTRIGGDGLTEYWDNFRPYEDDDKHYEKFFIKTQIDPAEFNRTDNFEKCLVNKVNIYKDEDFVATDFATVCFGRGTITPSELPDTGAEGAVALTGLFILSAGYMLKKRFTSK